jgi:hypothetical protein
MRFPYSAAGKPLLPLTPTLDAQTVSAEGLVDSGSDVSVLPWSVGNALAATWDLRKTTLRLGGTLAGTPAMPLLVMAKIANFAPVRLASLGAAQMRFHSCSVRRTSLWSSMCVSFARDRSFRSYPKAQVQHRSSWCLRKAPLLHFFNRNKDTATKIVEKVNATQQLRMHKRTPALLPNCRATITRDAVAAGRDKRRLRELPELTKVLP